MGREAEGGRKYLRLERKKRFKWGIQNERGKEGIRVEEKEERKEMKSVK